MMKIQSITNALSIHKSIKSLIHQLLITTGSEMTVLF